MNIKIVKNMQSIFSALVRKVRKFFSYFSLSLKNKYLNTLFMLILFSAIVHILILFYIAITTANLNILNYFSILQINYFIPNFLSDFWGNIISIIFVIFIYFTILFISKNE